MAPRGRLMLTLVLLAAGTVSTAHGLPGAGATTPPGPEQRGIQMIRLGAVDPGALVPLDVDRIIPGTTLVQRFRLHLGDAIRAGHPQLGIETVRNWERGCGHPEIAAGDRTCGSGDNDGELSSQLMVGVTWRPLPAAGCDVVPAARPVGSLRQLAGTTLTADAAVQASAPDTCMVLTLSLPTSADNLVQSDAVSFDLRVGATAAEHVSAETAVHGDSISAAGGVRRPAVSDLAGAHPTALPFTGAVFGVGLRGSVGLLLLGLLVLTMSRRRVPADCLSGRPCAGGMTVHTEDHHTESPSAHS